MAVENWVLSLLYALVDGESAHLLVIVKYKI